MTIGDMESIGMMHLNLCTSSWNDAMNLCDELKKIDNFCVKVFGIEKNRTYRSDSIINDCVILCVKYYILRCKAHDDRGT